jgi:hypothetical protein
MWSQPINSSILKNLCQAKIEKHMNIKIMNIILMKATWSYQEDNNWWSYPTNKKKSFKNECMEDMKWCVSHDGS